MRPETRENIRLFATGFAVTLALAATATAALPYARATAPIPRDTPRPILTCKPVPDSGRCEWMLE